MGSGFIQLVAKGNEDNIFNKNPHITFFKIYYRRHTNFFINNIEILSNTINKNNSVNFVIPKNGDLLSKSFLCFNFDDYYFELFKDYDNLYTTLTTNILNYYDTYDVRVNSFNINKITKIETLKLSYYYTNKIFMTLMITNNTDNVIDYIKKMNNIKLEVDENNLFYNINLNYNFYSFIINKNDDIKISDNTNKNDYFLDLYTNSINFKNIDFIRIDFINYNLSFKITNNNDNNFYYTILDYFKYNLQISETTSIKINERDFYISLDYQNIINIYKNFINLVLNKNQDSNVEIITNKKKSLKFTLDIKKLSEFFLNINSNTYNYYNITINSSYYDIRIYSLKNSLFFGNLENSEFNESLIQNESNLINIFNLCNTKNFSTNVYINLLISLVCDQNLSIQEYLKVTSNNNFQLSNSFLQYNNKIDQFDKKILDILINQDILFLIIILLKFYYLKIKIKYILIKLLHQLLQKK